MIQRRETGRKRMLNKGRIGRKERKSEQRN